MTILEMKGIKKAFSGVEVLKGIDLSCAEGEVLGIIGPSGSGKSTLLRIATFLETADSGEISYNGKTVGKQGEEKNLQEAKALVGLVFQNFNLFPHWTVLENVTDALIHVQKKEKAFALEKGRDLLARMGLLEKAEQYPYALSDSKSPCFGAEDSVL